MSSKIPRGLHAESKETEHRDAGSGTTTTNTVHKRKNVASKVYNGVSTRHELQAELTEQNKNLTAANERLQRNLAETQLRVGELELKFVEMEKENVEVQKNLKDCHVLLVAANMDPVSGERITEAAKEHEEQREQVKSVSADLLNELKNFGNVASRQRSQLQEVEGRMRAFAAAREHMTRERQNFSEDAAELERALEDADALLM